MLDATEDVFSRYMDTSKWERIGAAEWAVDVVRGIERDDHVVLPSGSNALTKLVSREGAFPLDPLSDRSFSRQPRR
jgi:hypothetical protein